MRSPRLDHFLGCLYGCAIGDALGAPFIGRPAHAVRLDANAGLAYTRLPAFPLGQYTDDTQMTLAVARSIADTGSIDGAAMAETFKTLWKDGTIVGPRGTCTRAMETLLAGSAAWDQAAVPPPCADVGSATRVAPVGLWHAKPGKDLVADALACSRVTHGDDLAGAAAVAVAAAVGYLASHDDLVAGRVLYRVSMAAGAVQNDFGEQIAAVGDVLYESPEVARRTLMQVALGENGNDAAGVPDAAAAVVLWALYCMLHDSTDWSAAVANAINGGGATDASGAIVGAALGAHVGVEAMPEALVEGLWDGDQVYDVALSLFERYAQREEAA